MARPVRIEVAGGQWLHPACAVGFNTRHERSGHLFATRGHKGSEMANDVWCHFMARIAPHWRLSASGPSPSAWRSIPDSSSSPAVTAPPSQPSPGRLANPFEQVFSKTLRPSAPSSPQSPPIRSLRAPLQRFALFHGSLQLPTPRRPVGLKHEARNPKQSSSSDPQTRICPDDHKLRVYFNSIVLLSLTC